MCELHGLIRRLRHHLGPESSALNIKAKTVNRLPRLRFIVQIADHAGQMPCTPLQVRFSNLAEPRDNQREHDTEEHNDDRQLDKCKAFRGVLPPLVTPRPLNHYGYFNSQLLISALLPSPPGSPSAP